MNNKYYTKKQRRDDMIYETLEAIKYYAQKIFETLIILFALYFFLFFMCL